MTSPRLSSCLPLALAASIAAEAAPAIPTEPGWRGFVNVGVGAGQSETNMLAGISSIDLGDKRIGSLEEDPGSEDLAFPALQFEFNYTLADTRTQFYIRNQPSPYIFLDQEGLAGIRQQIPGIGIVDLALSTTTLATDVWKDPYLLDIERGNTERTTKGVHMAWHNVMDSALSFEFSSKEVEIDDEESGESLVLTGDAQRLLRRTGEVYRYHASYSWQINGRHRLVPALSWLDYDLDGGAMAEEGPALQLTFEYSLDRWRLLGQLQYAALEADSDNPIYGERTDRDVMLAAVTVSYAEPFGLKQWEANARVHWYESDNDVDFYDESLAVFRLGMLYRFD